MLIRAVKESYGKEDHTDGHKKLMVEGLKMFMIVEDIHKALVH
jgi:hypothetical protein